MAELIEYWRGLTFKERVKVLAGALILAVFVVVMGFDVALLGLLLHSEGG